MKKVSLKKNKVISKLKLQKIVGGTEKASNEELKISGEKVYSFHHS